MTRVIIWQIFETLCTRNLGETPQILLHTKECTTKKISSPGQVPAKIQLPLQEVSPEKFRNQTGSRIHAHVHDIGHDEKFPCACMHKYARATTQHTTRTWNLLTTRRPFRRALPRASGLDQDLPAISAPPSVRGKGRLSLTLFRFLRKSMRTSLGQSQ